MSNYQKYFGKINNKRIIPFLNLREGTPKASIVTLVKGLNEVVDQCNARQSDIILGIHIIEGETEEPQPTNFSITVETNSGFDDETIKTYFISQAITLLGTNVKESITQCET